MARTQLLNRELQSNLSSVAMLINVTHMNKKLSTMMSMSLTTRRSRPRSSLMATTRTKTCLTMSNPLMLIMLKFLMLRLLVLELKEDSKEVPFFKESQTHSMELPEMKMVQLSTEFLKKRCKERESVMMIS